MLPLSAANFFASFNGLGIEIVAFRAGEGEIGAQLGADVHQGYGDVIAISHKGDIQTFQRTEIFLKMVRASAMPWQGWL